MVGVKYYKSKTGTVTYPDSIEMVYKNIIAHRISQQEKGREGWGGEGKDKDKDRFALTPLI